MNERPIHNVLQQPCQASSRRRLDPCADRDLLRRLVDDGDQDAFAVVMQRHAALVLATCKR